MKKFLNEFKTFISRGNVMDMAIGVVIATAFGKISASLVADIIMPLIGCLIGGVDLATLNITLKPAVMDGETVVSEAVVLGLGTFLTTIIDFLLIAFVVFLVVKAMNMAKAKLEKPAEEEAPGYTFEDFLDFCQALEGYVDIIQIRGVDGSATHVNGLNYKKGHPHSIDYAAAFKAHRLCHHDIIPRDHIVSGL